METIDVVGVCQVIQAHVITVATMDKAQMPPSLTSSTECLSLPDGGSKLVGSDQNQRGRPIDFFNVNWSL